MALGTLKVGRWSRKAGSCCIRWSFCVELSLHGKQSLRAGGRSNQVLIYSFSPQADFQSGNMASVSYSSAIIITVK